MADAAGTTGNRAVDARRSGTSVEAPARTTGTTPASTPTQTSTPGGTTTVAEEPIDGQAGWHRQVAIDAFARAWELIELGVRTPEQDRELLALAFTSRYHWGW